jgi:gluconolactonase
MGVLVKSAALADLVDTGAEVERLATGFAFTEGPIWNAAEGALYFSDMPGDVRRRWSSQDGVREVMRPSNMGNGMVYDAEGNLLICEHATSTFVRERPDGTRETLASHFEGSELNSPNDVCVRSDGTIYFTDPVYGRIPYVGVERDQELDFQGVYRLAPGAEPGGDPVLSVARDEFDQPNGLCFSPDESLLYVDDSPRAEVKVFDVGPDGSLSNPRVLLGGIGTGVVEEGLPDGMKVDERGNVWVTGPGGVWVISPEGEHLGVIEVPENVANLAWGGEDYRTLFVTASTSLYRIETRVASTRLPYH